jgi:hypothetical protein
MSFSFKVIWEQIPLPPLSYNLKLSFVPCTNNHSVVISATETCLAAVYFDTLQLSAEWKA